MKISKHGLLFSFLGGALGRAALIFLVSASASAARKIFSERERERRSEKSGMSASASGARKIRERLILCKQIKTLCLAKTSFKVSK